MQGDGVAARGTQRRPPLEELRACQGDDQDGLVSRPLEERVDEVEQAVVGPLEVLEDQRRPCRAWPPPRRTVATPRTARSDRRRRQPPRPSRTRKVGLDPATVLGVVDVCVEGQPRASRSRPPAGRSPATPPGSGPSRRVPSRRSPRRTPATDHGASRSDSTRPSTYFSSSHASRLLPMTRLAGDGDVARPSLRRRSLASASLSARSSAARPTNGASSRSARPTPRRPATTRIARHAGDRQRLALDLVLAGGLEHDRVPRCACSVASPTRTVPGSATPWSRDARVDEVAGDQPLTLSARGSPPPRRSGRRRERPGRRSRSRSPGRPTASTRSSAARTARSASSSWAVGAPQTAMTASPMNFSTVPP